MKYPYLLFTLLTLLTLPLSAQKLSLDAQINYTPVYQANYVASGISVSYISFGRIERRIRTAQFNVGFRNLIRQRLVSQPGIGLNMNVDFAISERLHFQTGLGLEYQSFRLEQNIIDSDARILSIDTLDVEFVDQVSGLCNEYTNSPPNFGEEDLTQNYRNLSVNMPAFLTYQLKNKWQLVAGVRASVPVYNTLQREQTILEQDWQREDYLVCTYVVDDNRNNADNLSNLQLSGLARIQYQVTPQWGLGLSAEQFFSNVFENAAGTEERVPHNDFEFRPLRIGLVLNYAL